MSVDWSKPIRTIAKDGYAHRDYHHIGINRDGEHVGQISGNVNYFHHDSNGKQLATTGTLFDLENIPEKIVRWLCLDTEVASAACFINESDAIDWHKRFTNKGHTYTAPIRVEFEK